MKDVPLDSAAQAAQSPQEEDRAKWPAVLDPFKIVALLMTLTGIVAWVAGEAYTLGYWEAAHYPRGVAELSLQSLALRGFYGAYKCWTLGVLVVAGYGVLGLIPAVRVKRATPRKQGWLTRAAQRCRHWLVARFEFDAPYAVTGVLLLGTAIFYYGVIISPALVWVFGAYQQGRELLEKQACQARAGATPTSINLADGTTLHGHVIERSDKLIALLTKDAVVMVTDSEKGGHVVESTSLASISCSRSGPN
ncbi:hypothetical protein R20233_01435 [Ralstonia sp. LMG 32965]|uniref:hypothetical protein n=1 Tax=Ralstonia flatus TaxID=3058601 RepID=UPI0028F5D826|nr:hypothetical protein [Ralstonia sp. LMG 32965]CAJ0867685.1 hypothetical protein R20233_01435 [Ralstonia sp. LMG 32965]